jgi:hypothetical protein
MLGPMAQARHVGGHLLHLKGQVRRHDVIGDQVAERIRG